MITPTHRHNIEEHQISSITYRPDFLHERAKPERVKILTKIFDPKRIKLGQLSIRADGTKISLDGWHTDQTCLAKGLTTRQYEVFYGLTPEEEAAHFAAQHAGEERQHTTKIFNLKATAGEYPQRAIASIIEPQLRVSKHPAEDHVIAPGALVKVYSNFGEEILSDLVLILAPPDGWTSPEGVKSLILEGLAEALVRGKPAFDSIQLRDALKDYGGHNRLTDDALGEVVKGKGSRRLLPSQLPHVVTKITQIYNRYTGLKVSTAPRYSEARYQEHIKQVRQIQQSDDKADTTSAS